jgi:hypothetical protein
VSCPQAELDAILKDYVGRETPLYHAERLSARYKRPDGTGPEIYLKREDLNHTGAHKINNSLGQALLCLRMGKKRIIAETGAGAPRSMCHTPCTYVSVGHVVGQALAVDLPYLAWQIIAQRQQQAHRTADSSAAQPAGSADTPAHALPASHPTLQRSSESLPPTHPTRAAPTSA